MTDDRDLRWPSSRDKLVNVLWAAAAEVGVKHVNGSRDHFRLGSDFYMAFMYGDIADESDFLRSGKSIYLELKSDNVDEMRRKIVEFGVKVECSGSSSLLSGPGRASLPARWDQRGFVEV